MESSPFREDVLEAIARIQVSGKAAVRPEDIASVLGSDPSLLGEALSKLEREGNLVREPDGSLALTQAGKEIGERVMRKHRILECFFSELLGMSPEVASDEACILEHGVSDEAIERLRQYLRSPGMFWHHGGRQRIRWQGVSLLDSEEGDDLDVSCVRCGGPDSRLGDLGILPGERIRLIRRIPGNGVVIRVKGCDIALSSEIASSILVERAP